MRPDDDGGPTLPPSIPPVPPPEGDPTTLHGYSRRYLQQAWWLETLHKDLIDTGKWIMHAMSFDGSRDLIHGKLLGVLGEAGLHQRGYTLAGHACEKYAKRIELLRQGNAELNRQAGLYNQKLTAISSHCPGGVVPPDQQAAVDALFKQHYDITSAIRAGEELERNAAETAAKEFLAAKVCNSHDLGILRRAADPNLSADQRRALLMEAFGFAVVPGLDNAAVTAQFNQMMERAGMRAVFESVTAEFEAGLASGAVRGGSKALGLAGPIGVIVAVLLDLALFPDTLANGDVDDDLFYNSAAADALQKQKLYDEDGNEVKLPATDDDPEPEADAGGAKPPYDCDKPDEGDQWGGPGYWHDVNRGDYDALWKRYQEQVTGVARGHEYTYRNVDYDGYTNENGRDIFIEAKSRGYAKHLTGATVDADGNITVTSEHTGDKLKNMLDQIRRQLNGIRDHPDARLRYVMAEDEALKKIRAYAKQHLDPADYDKIEWQHQDNDFDFDGC